MTARRVLALLVSLGLLLALAAPATAKTSHHSLNLYRLHKLVSDIPGRAAITDPDLVNGWGISASATSPWWVSDEGTDKSTLYNGATGAKVGLTVAVAGGPTGQVFNGSADFKVDAGTGLLPSRFIFATGDGQIEGWNGVGTVAINGTTTPGASYLGLAIGSTGGANYLYAANFAARRVDVLDGTFTIAHLGGGSFTDPWIPASYSPFGIQNVGSEIFVAYAKTDGADEIKGHGLGFVSAFGTDGSFHGRVGSRGGLNAPWGIAKAPANFGRFSNDLLVGNFGDGLIHAFHWNGSGYYERGVLRTRNGRPLRIDGLWGIGFGNGAGAGPTNTLFFAAGPKDEKHGLFGSITAP